MTPLRQPASQGAAPVPPASITEAQLLAAITLVSEIVIEHGARYAPLLDRLEAELAARRRDDPVSRARAHLARARGEPAAV